MKQLFILFLLVVVSNLNAQEANLLKDFSSGGMGTFRYDAKVINYPLGNQLFFILDHEKYGKELWRTNGTEVGTQLVRDINPGKGSSHPNFVNHFNNVLLFNASTDSGQFLFTTTGSSASTKLLTDQEGNNVRSAVNPAWLNGSLYFFSSDQLYRTQGTPQTTQKVEYLSEISFFSPFNIIKLGNKLIFIASNQFTGSELFIFNEATNEVKLLKDINPGSLTSQSFPLQFIPVGDQVFFISDDGTHGKELWKTDGTEAGTSLIKDLTPGSESSEITLFGEINGTLYFTLKESNIIRDLWKTDGTEAGTLKVPGDLRGASPIIFKGELYFSGDNRLYKTDGEEETRLTDISVSGPFAATDDWLYFLENSSDGIKLWRTDGSEEGEEFISNISEKSYYDVENLYAAGDFVYFTAETDSFGIELWASDGTENGTQMLIDSRPGPTDGFESWYQVQFGSIGNSLIFAGYSEKNGRELWISGGTPEKTRELRDLTPRTQDVSLDGVPVELKGYSYFLADSSLWKTNGTSKGTEMIMNFQSTNIGGLHALSDKLVFSAHHPLMGRTVWTSDGTAKGTQPLFDTSNNIASVILMFATNPVFKNEIYFMGLNNLGYELWKTDGTVEGTLMVKDIWEGNTSSDLNFSGDRYTVFNDHLYFSASSEVLGNELWRTDGTEEGTVPVTDINPQGSSLPSNLTVLNDIILFSARDANNTGAKLWKTDGSIEGTTLVKDISINGNGYVIDGFVRFKDHVYFTGFNPEFGIEIWRTDGTGEGTELFTDLRVGSPGSYPSKLSVIGNHLYFLANTGDGRRLMRSDGTVEGTVEVIDMTVGSGYLEAEGNIFFDATTDSTGQELWRLPAGQTEPILMTDIMEGEDDSEIYLLNYINNTLFFKAFDNIHGSEIWTIKPLEPSITIVSSGTPLCSEEDILRLTARLSNTGDDPEIFWYLNGSLIPRENKTSIELSRLKEGDIITATVIADNDLWLKSHKVESEKFRVTFQIPIAEITINQNILTASVGESYIWYRDGSPLTDTTRTIIVSETGIYTVEVFNEFGCSALSNPVSVIIDPTYMDTFGGNRDILMYPNPASGFIRLRSDMDKKLAISILSMKGEYLYSEKVRLHANEEYEIQVGFLEEGIYLIQMVSESDTFRRPLIIHQ